MHANQHQLFIHLFDNLVKNTPLLNGIKRYMTSLLWLLAIIFFSWILVNIKTSRSDGTQVKQIHPYRKVLFQILKSRTESQVFFEHRLNMEPLLEFLENQPEHNPITINHCAVAAVNRALSLNDELDRFVMGGRLYQRKQRSISFTVKKEKLNRKAALGTAKLDMIDGESFQSLCERVSDSVKLERASKPTSVDKELNLLSLIPPPIMSAFVRASLWLNQHHLLPKFFIQPDVMHTSAFIANLGSLDMKSAYHHLYEWGTCPIFLTIGHVEEFPVLIDDEFVMQKTLVVKFSFDERIADGLTAWETIKAGLLAVEKPELFV